MPYIGNTIRAADDYRLIDDISSGFNGSTTSFALQVAGSAPVPFPKSPQQVLISVNGVIQEPDPTGSSGFNLVGTNIVFSSAPTNGHAFFGIIYATADYLNAGGNFPAGSLGAPSITFIGDENTGLFRKSGGSVGFVSDATEIANFDSNGITISSGNLIIPDSIIHSGDSDTKIRFREADTITVETAGAEKFRINSTGKFTMQTPGGDDAVLVKGDTFTAVRIESARDDGNDHAMFEMAGSRGTNASKSIVQANDKIGTISARAWDGNSFSTLADIVFKVDGTPGDGDMPGRILFFTSSDGSASPTERLAIGSDGVITAQRSGTFGNTSDNFTALSILASTSGISELRFGDTTANAGFIKYTHSEDSLLFATPTTGGGQGTERMRIDVNGRIGVGTATINSHKMVIEGGVAGTQSSSLALKVGDGANSKVADLAFYSTFVTPNNDTADRRSADITSGFSTANWGNEFLDFRVGKGGASNDGEALTDLTVRLNASGNVGIGTTGNAANTKVQIVSNQLGGTAGDEQDIATLSSPDVSNTTTYKFTNRRLSNGTTHTSSSLRFRRHVDVTDQGFFGLGDGFVNLGYGTTEYFRMNNIGRLGLGTTAPNTTADFGGISSNGLGGLSNHTFYSGYFQASGNSFAGIVLGAGANGNVPFVAAARKFDGTGTPLDLIVDGARIIRCQVGGNRVINFHDSTGLPGLGNTNQGMAFETTLGSVFLSRNQAHSLYVNNNGTGDQGLIKLLQNGVEVSNIKTQSNNLASDQKVKKDIEALPIGLDFVNKLAPKQFRYNTSESTDPLCYGLIAQELETSLTSSGVSKNSSLLCQYEALKETDSAEKSEYWVDYTKLVPVLINAVKELSAKVGTLETEVAALKAG